MKKFIFFGLLFAVLGIGTCKVNAEEQREY